MILSDFDIQYELFTGHLVIDPIDDLEKQLQPASVDLRLGHHFRGGDALDEPGNWPNGYVLKPGEFVLGHTVETVRLPNNLAGRVEGRSSWGRRGIMVHLTAGFIDPGFHGQITLEILNVSKLPVFLPYGERICQLSLYRMTSSSARPYGHPSRGGSYNGQTGATPARKR